MKIQFDNQSRVLRMFFVSILAGNFMGFSAMAAEADEGTAAKPDNVFIVVGVTDLAGVLTVNVVNSSQYSDLKKEVALDNKAMARAYDNLKSTAYDKYTADYKAEMANMRQAQNNNQRGGGQQQQQQKRRTPFQFALKESKPRELHFYGSYTSEAAAAEQKKVYEDKDLARITSIQKAEDEKIRQEQSGLGLKKVVYKKKENAEPPKELTDQFTAEIERVKKEMVDNPGNISAGKRAGKPAGDAAAAEPKKKDPSKQLGGEIRRELKSSKKIKGALGS